MEARVLAGRARGGGPPKRWLLRVLPLALVLVIVPPPTVAQAGGAWDPDDPAYHLDVRWVGVYVQADGRMRVTMSFYAPVRLRWFNYSRGWRRAYVGFTDQPTVAPYYCVGFFRDRRGRLSAQFCEGGSICSPVVRATRPDRSIIRATVDPSREYGPGVGWRFRGITLGARAVPPRDRPRVIDRTVLGFVS
jgi:hypothetical protein